MLSSPNASSKVRHACMHITTLIIICNVLKTGLVIESEKLPVHGLGTGNVTDRQSGRSDRSARSGF